MTIKQRPVEQFDSVHCQNVSDLIQQSAHTLGLGRQQIACRAIVEDGISRER